MKLTVGASFSRSELCLLVATKAVEISGPGSFAVFGDDVGLASALRANGVRVVTFQAADLVEGRLVLEHGAFLIALNAASGLAPDMMDRLLGEIARNGRGALFAFDLSRGDLDASLRERWEDRAFLAGLRRHPCYFEIADYGGLEHERGLSLIALETLPLEAQSKYPLSGLAEERPLHMDMARETGRRSDGHMVKYAMAAGLVRPGDVVVDAACGLGYGSHMLRNSSPAKEVIGLDLSEGAIEYARDCYGAEGVRFDVADVQALSALPDSSCDVFVSFETLEHVPDPETVIRQAFRVLRPGGRFIASVPYDWSDETGQDPNPFHLHVYDKRKLVGQVEGSFLLEKLWVQDAGGGFKHPQAQRAIREIDPNTGEEPGEWLVVVGMKDPVGALVPFADTIYPDAGDAENIVAFARDYDNPWLMRSMFGMSVRMSNPPLLEGMCRRVLTTSRPGSADRGAAVCVLGYMALGKGDAASRDEAILLADRYIGAADGTPHATRWVVSLHFLKGRLALDAGDRSGAETSFLECMKGDWASFSPTLVTKVIESAWTLGRMRQSDGNLEGAREAWRNGISALCSALSSRPAEFIGNPDRPLPDPLPEMAHAIDLGRRCGQALAGTFDGSRSAIRSWNEAARNLAADRTDRDISHLFARQDLARQVERFDRIKGHRLVRLALPVARRLVGLLRR